MNRSRARTTTIATLLAVVCASSTSRADQPAPPPEPAVAPRQPPPPSPPPAAAADPAWSQYDDAFVQLGQGDADAAHSGLLQLTTRWPAHPAAVQAALRLAELDARVQARATRQSGSANRVARGELVFWSTLSGVMIATNLCLDNCSTAREYAAVYSLTIGAGLGLSLLATRHGIEPAEAQLYNSAQTWGSWNALAINDGFAHDNPSAAIAIGAQFAGLAAGLGLWRTWKPGPGDVGLANTGLLWGALLSVYGQSAVSHDASLQSVVVLGDVGLVAGALIAHQVPMSRGRTLIIDLGGVLGTLAGGLILTSSPSDETAFGVMFTTTAAGLVIAGIATRDWDVEPPRSLRVVPARIGTPGAGAAWGAAVAIDL